MKLRKPDRFAHNCARADDSPGVFRKDFDHLEEQLVRVMENAGNSDKPAHTCSPGDVADNAVSNTALTRESSPASALSGGLS